MENKKRSGMVLYFDMRSLFERLSAEETKELLLAIMDYAENGVVPTFRCEKLDCFWPLLTSRMDADRDRYERRVAASRRAAYIRWAAHEEEMSSEEEDTCE